MIAWKYLNKHSAAITAIQDYKSMRQIINITPQEIKDVYDKMCSPRATRLTGQPSVHNPQSGEESLVNSLGELDVLQERYKQAVEYMCWFEPAWSRLTDTEHKILEEFYMGENLRSGASVRLEKELGYCERQIHRLRAKALSTLVVLLFGK